MTYWAHAFAFTSKWQYDSKMRSKFTIIINIQEYAISSSDILKNSVSRKVNGIIWMNKSDQRKLQLWTRNAEGCCELTLFHTHKWCLPACRHWLQRARGSDGDRHLSNSLKDHIHDSKTKQFLFSRLFLLFSPFNSWQRDMWQRIFAFQGKYFNFSREIEKYGGVPDIEAQQILRRNMEGNTMRIFNS